MTHINFISLYFFNAIISLMPSLVITILIGPNDFCLDFCYQNEPKRSPDNHRRDLIETLRILRDNLPRTIVNVVTPPSEYILFHNKSKSTTKEKL